MVKLTFKIWLLIIIVLASIISIFSIPPMFLEKGVDVKSVSDNSSIFNQGLRAGTRIIGIDSTPINNLQDYQKAMTEFSNQAKLSSSKETKLTIRTTTGEIVGLFSSDIVNNITVAAIPPTRIKTGLDIQGGVRALVAADLPKGEKLSDSDLSDLISISEERLNVYGLSDVRLFKVETSDGNRLMGVEIAGSNPKDLQELIAKQGKFEAKIANKTVFVGGNKDITYVGRSGQDAGISECYAIQGGEACTFRFVVYLSEEAAQRHADITSNISLNLSSGGKYLGEKIDFFLDGKLTTSLNIGADLKGKVATQIQISGSGSGLTRKEALDSANAEMKKLQTVLITGSLPFKLKISKIDQLSPNLGENFVQHLLFAGLFSIIAVSIIVLIRYRKIKVSIALIVVSMSEVVIILGIAALIKWNLDLPSIAGIIATIGTGIDSQLIILDESRDKHQSLKLRIKKALFIIGAAFATSLVSLVPLTGALSFMGIAAASAGMLKGFAVTTIIGITAGILITRPAFADISRQFENDEDEK